MKCLGLDFGEKTIGIAVSDDLSLTAQGVTTLYRKSLSQDMAALEQLVKDYQASQIVIGLPLNMNGTEGGKAREVRQFMQQLERHFGDKVSVIPWDERLSTMAAERGLLEADLSRAKRRKVIDKMAAVFILQGYLDSIITDVR
ncbi:MAG: Holliday junction resolvase RuvX [Deltaproteobacteria bacterium]|nr:Holliday junction resolvase RuvX [Deltaproteobacteria bacterium]